MNRHPSIFQLGHVDHDGDTVSIHGWGLACAPPAATATATPSAGASSSTKTRNAAGSACTATSPAAATAAPVDRRRALRRPPRLHRPRRTGHHTMTTTEHRVATLAQHIAELPDRLRSYRERSGLSLRELATAIGGMNHSTLHRIERGEDFTVSRLLAITTYLDGQSS